MEDRSIHNAQRFDELGLDPLNLVLVVLQLEDSTERVGEFPLAALDRAETIGEFVALVELWRFPREMDKRAYPDVRPAE